MQSIYNTHGASESRRGETHLYKMKTHLQNQAEVSQLNNKVDGLADQAALLDDDSLWVKADQKIYQVQPQTSQGGDVIDIVDFQHKDAEIKNYSKRENIEVATSSITKMT